MKKIFYPIILALAVILGIVIDQILTGDNLKANVSKIDYASKHEGKLDMLLNLIDMQYVDTVDCNQLVEKVIPELLANLDPHSVYIPADEVQIVNDDLGSSFSGIGVQFNIQNDTIVVVQVIHGGPSEKLGIQPGDRIVEVDDSAFVGKKISSDLVVKKLRGRKNTKVSVGIKRFGIDHILHYTILRDDVPTKSIDVSYLLQTGIGYIKVNKFGESTYEEFHDALVSLRLKGASSFVIDLRENSGGYLDQAIHMTNEFLHKGEMIVYTEGKAQKREEAKADGRGAFQREPIAVLIDEWSASASEIFAGAIQDNDRGVIVGRRSFGKGLVQQQIPMWDKSAVRLTIARYYTPSGRCIQKSYQDKEEYQKEVYNRYLDGELYSDSIRQQGDSIQYYTSKGRIVYGGGGITPDVIVVKDSIGITPYYTKLYNSGLIYEYAFKYSDEHREQLSKMSLESLSSYLDTNEHSLCELLINYAKKKGVQEPIATSHLSPITRKKMSNRMKEYIVRNILGDESFYMVMNENDKMLDVAIKEMKKFQISQ